MNFKGNPRHIMRIIALVISIALIFSGITVFYAAEEDGTPAAAGTSSTDTSSTDNAGPTAPEKEESSGSDASSGSNTSGSDTSAGNTSGSDTSDGNTSDSDTSEDDEELGKGTCPWCGGSNYYRIYDEKKDEVFAWCDDKECHTHDFCRECFSCGGCMCALYGEACYDENKKACEPCTCFSLDYEGYAGESMTAEQAQAMVAAKGSKDIKLDDYIAIYTADTQGISLSQALADGAKIKALTASGAPVNTKAYGATIDCIVPTSGGEPEPMFTYDNRFVDGAKASTPSVVIHVSLSLEYKGTVKNVSFDYIIDFVGESAFKEIKLSEGSENVKIEVGQNAKLVYDVTMTEKDAGFDYYFYIGNYEVADVECMSKEDGKGLELNIAGLKEGKTAFRIVFISVSDEEERVNRVVNVEVVKPSVPAAPSNSVSFENPSIESGKDARLNISGWYDGKTLAESSKCCLPMKWTVGTKNGAWELPGAGATNDVMTAMLVQHPAVKGLAVGDHNARVDFQTYERGTDGLWYPISGDVYRGTAAVKVVGAASSGGNNTTGGLENPNGGNGGNGGSSNNGSSNNGGNNNGGGNNTTGGTDGGGNIPGTGDIVRENPGARIAGIVMLIAGLFIFGTLAAERIYREMQARKRQAEAVRR